MASKIKENVRQTYERYNADEEGMDRFVMEHYQQVEGSDRFSKKIMHLIGHEMKENDITIIEVLSGIALATASYIDALEKAGCGKNAERAFMDCFLMSRIVVGKREDDEAAENEEDEN